MTAQLAKTDGSSNDARSVAPGRRVGVSLLLLLRRVERDEERL